MVEVSCIIDGKDKFYGPYINKQLMQMTLNIIKKTGDDYAEPFSFDADPWEEKIMRGLLPFRVSVEIFKGQPQKPEIRLQWPPLDEEGIISESDFLIEYFFWALGRDNVLRRLSSVNRNTNTSTPKVHAHA